ncbi:MAG: M61 family metallopeptidase [Caulobacteraceae bacterium]
MRLWPPLLIVLAASTAIAATRSGEPQPAPAPALIPAPRDIAYPGVIDLAVDATDTAHALFGVKETIPVARAGPMILVVPTWLPGTQSPSGQNDRLAGLEIRAGGAPVPWRRDPVDMYAFHLDVPAGARRLDLSFQFLTPANPSEGRMAVSPEIVNLEWNEVVLYPAGFFSRDIEVRPSITLPAGFSFATALSTASKSAPGGQITAAFAPVPLNQLVDSPLVAGRWFKRLDLDPGAKPTVNLDIFADRPDELAITPAELADHRALVAQAGKLFGASHYDHYDFLLWLSDRLGGEGLEHHQSSEDGSKPGYFTEWADLAAERDLLPHEYTHSWNGKFRRPADLWAANFNTAERDSLLWVYEGQTQYWGFVLAARSGLLTKAQTLDALAEVAAVFGSRPGRVWRDLEDTTDAEILDLRETEPWPSWQRGEDYYSEGQLIWLDVDTLIRQLSGGKRSLDDFAGLFFGPPSTGPITRTYTFEDLVSALNEVQPYDWARFLHERLTGLGPQGPLDGITRGGYRLVFTDKESAYQKSEEKDFEDADFTFSIGLDVGKEGGLEGVLWDGPAFKAGLRKGAKLIAVNGEEYDAETLSRAIADAKTTAAPIALLVKQDERYFTAEVDYHGGLRYPHLEPVGIGPRLLDQILTPRR